MQTFFSPNLFLFLRHYIHHMHWELVKQLFDSQCLRHETNMLRPFKKRIINRRKYQTNTRQLS